MISTMMYDVLARVKTRKVKVGKMMFLFLHVLLSM